MKKHTTKIINLAISLLYIDLFCGAGGTSTGVESAKLDGLQCAKVIACVNHDEKAIASHAANHPDALHFTEDIRTLDLTDLCAHVKNVHKYYPLAKIILWASLECTNFSKAKGGQARDADSRTLAEHLLRYIDALQPDCVQVENVEEFMSWGKVCENGKPISKDKGRDFMRWVKNIQSCGYSYDYRILNAADFGALTSRKRFFAQFAKPDFPLVWPEQTHAKNVKDGELFSDLEKWRPVKEVLDFDDEGVSIFAHKKQRSEKTLERVYAGLVKFVAGGKDKWLLKYNSMSSKGVHVPPDIDEPSPVISTQGRIGIVRSVFLSKYFSGDPENKNISVEQPAGSVTCIDHHSIVNVKFLSSYYGNGANISSVDAPGPTLTTKDRIAKVHCSFIDQQFGKSSPASVDNALGALTTNPKYAKVHINFATVQRVEQSCDNGHVWIDTEENDLKSICPNCGQFGTSSTYLYPEGINGANDFDSEYNLTPATFFMNQYSGGGQTTDLNTPAGTILTNPKQNLVTCIPWIMDTSFNNIGSGIDQPSKTITANRKWHYLMNPQFNSCGSSIDNPSFTLIARMDKRPPYLIEISQYGDLPHFIKIVGNTIIYEIYEDDTPMIKKIKEFMALYQLVDIKMRMLRIPELKQIMGFPKEYVLIGTQADQKKFIGNAVEVNMARKICEATAGYLHQHLKIA